MSAIAGVLLEMGYDVHGSDIKKSRHTKVLEKGGAKIFIGHKPDNINGADIVVYSSAISTNNVEFAQAKKLGLKIKKRAEMLSEIASHKSLIAVTGTHGKTTTTSMTSAIMVESGEDPMYLIGAELNEIGANSRYGKGRYCIAEADESDGSLLFLKPEILVITNIENDHLEFYGNISGIESVFLRFVNDRVAKDGFVVICGDEENLLNLSSGFKRNVVKYGMEEHNDLIAKDIRLGDFSSRFKVHLKGRFLGEVFLRVPGVHNVYNALASIYVGLISQIGFSNIAKGLGSFKGVKRRFEILGSVGGITIVDDYAHHPSEIKATLKAARNGEWKRIIALFQPHRYSRTKLLVDDFGSCFEDADMAILTDVYGAGEDPIPGITGKLIVNSILQSHPWMRVVYLPRMSEIASYLMPVVQPDDLLLIMGAGDICSIGQELVSNLEKNILKSDPLHWKTLYL